MSERLWKQEWPPVIELACEQVGVQCCKSKGAYLLKNSISSFTMTERTLSSWSLHAAAISKASFGSDVQVSDPSHCQGWKWEQNHCWEKRRRRLHGVSLWKTLVGRQTRLKMSSTVRISGQGWSFTGILNQITVFIVLLLSISCGSSLVVQIWELGI